MTAACVAAMLCALSWLRDCAERFAGLSGSVSMLGAERHSDRCSAGWQHRSGSAAEGRVCRILGVGN